MVIKAQIMNSNRPTKINTLDLNRLSGQEDLPKFGGNANKAPVVPQKEPVVELDAATVMESQPTEKLEIDDFVLAVDQFLTPCDIKDTMAGYLPTFMTRLHSLKRLCKIEKFEAHVMKAIRETAVLAIQTRIVEGP